MHLFVQAIFNVLECRMPSHFENYYHECYNGGKDGASVVMLNNFDECVVTGYNRLDHVIHNSHIQVIKLNYPWDFYFIIRGFIFLMTNLI